MIPKILHQIWNDSHVPREFRGYQSTWLNHHPDWTYQLWTASSARHFVAEHFPSFLQVYDSYPRFIHRVDALRYLLMQRVGGVYVDLDFECLKPLDPLLAGEKVVLGYEPPTHRARHVKGLERDRLVGNAFMASVPGHPIWQFIMGLMPDYAQIRDPVQATGPVLLTRAIKASPFTDQLTITESNLLYPADLKACRAARGDRKRLVVPPEAFGIHHWYGTWAKPDAPQTHLKEVRRPRQGLAGITEPQGRSSRFLRSEWRNRRALAKGTGQ